MPRAVSDTAEAGVCEAFGIQAHFFLQPTSSVRDVKAGAPRSAMQSVYSALVEEAREGRTRNFDTLHDALDDLDKAYIDSIHYNESASQVLGARMAERIAEEWHSRDQ